MEAVISEVKTASIKYKILALWAKTKKPMSQEKNLLIEINRPAVKPN